MKKAAKTGLNRFRKIPGSGSPQSFESEENGRKVQILWREVPGLYQLVATLASTTGEHLALSLSEALKKAEAFLNTGELEIRDEPDWDGWRPKGWFDRSLAIAEAKHAR